MVHSNLIKNSQCITVEEVLQMIDSVFEKKRDEEMRAHIAQCPSCKQLYQNLLKLDMAIKTNTLLNVPKIDKTCLDELTIAAYVDNSLPGKEKDKADKHLRSCEHCLHQIVSLRRTIQELQTAKLENVPDAILVQTKQMIPEEIKGIRRWKNLIDEYLARANELFNQKYSLRWVGYAMSVLLIVFVISSSLIESNFNSTNIPVVEIRGEHKIIQNRLELFAPESGAIIRNNRISFIWKRLTNAEEYHFVLSNNVGDLIWETNIKRNIVKLPDNILLINNNEYFWKVEAILTTDHIISSPVSIFTIKKN